MLSHTILIQELVCWASWEEHTPACASFLFKLPHAIDKPYAVHVSGSFSFAPNVPYTLRRACSSSRQATFPSTSHNVLLGVPFFATGFPLRPEWVGGALNPKPSGSRF